MGKNRVLTVKQASKYLNLRQNTIYVYTCKKRIPFIKEGDKKHSRISFNTADLDKWLADRRKKIIKD